nr:cytochrome P450 [Antrihabitans stalactiti]
MAAFTEMFAYGRERTAEKRARPTDDVWSTIVNAEVDGERLSDDELDRFFQLLVIAGNDTTRNLLSNTLLTLSEHSDQFDRLRGDLSLLPTAVEEVLRFAPSVIQFRRTATRDLELAGQKIAENDKVEINYASANRDETVFTDPDRFDITRDPNPHVSFGDGTHFCLGSNLARLNARTILTEVLTRLPDIDASGPPVRLRSSFMNGINHLPAKFTPVPRPDRPVVAPGFTATTETAASQADLPPEPESPTHGTPLLVLFGSNFGTAEDVAQQVADEGERRGFHVRMAPLDEHVDDLPREGVVAIATATYNGTPPDNAVEFTRWLTDTEPDLTGIRYTVFGCGNSEWADTFQHLPIFIDGRMEKLGAQRLYARGAGDAADDFDGQLAHWGAGLWPTLGDSLGLDLGTSASVSTTVPRYRIEVVSGDRQSPFVDTFDARPMPILVNRELTVRVDGIEARPVSHLEFALPDGVEYAAGDHLGIIPHNSDSLVERVCRRFRIDPETRIRLHSDADGAESFLPLGERISVRRLLSDYVELQEVASRKDIQAMLEYTEYPWTRDQLTALLDPADEGRKYRDEVLARRRSVFDLLEEHQTCQLPLALFLQLLSPLAPRYYSISSSPRRDARRCSITVGALIAPARSGRGNFEGVCSNYLARQGNQQVIYAFVRDTGSKFRLPNDPRRPVIMIAAGTGIAPFRGFLHERASQAAAGDQLGSALLLFGARHPQSDLLYADELTALAESANTQLAYAFSRVPGLPKIYVQDRLRQLGDALWTLIEADAVIYICGSTSMADGVRTALGDLHRERSGGDAAAADRWLAELSAGGRYLVDVWASN